MMNYLLTRARSGGILIGMEPASPAPSSTGAANGQGTNSIAVRQFNERVVLTALRRLGEASKADLARRVNLTQNATGEIVRELERQHLIRTVGKRKGQRGQPAVLLCLDDKGAYAIGIKLGRR